MSKKNTIRLTESELKKVITESVRNIISELDWRTYASAADKRRKQYKGGDTRKYWSSAQELDDAASKALSKKYGRNLTTWGESPAWSDNPDRIVMDDTPWSEGSNAQGPEPMGYYYRSSKDRDWRKGNSEYQSGDMEYYHNIPFDREKYDFETDEDYQEHLQNNEIGREIDDFVHGRAQYTKGKGWHLKDNE